MSVAALSAVYLVFRAFPTFPMIGVGAFRASDILPSILCILFGPFVAVTSILIGTLLSFFSVAPPLFLGLDFLPATVNATIVGAVLKKKRMVPAGIFLSLIFLLSSHPYGAAFARGGVPFLWLHLIAFLLLVSPVSPRCPEWLKEPSHTSPFAAFAVLTFIGTMAQHVTGSLLTASLYSGVIAKQGVLAYWSVVFYLYPVERLVIVAASTFIGVAVFKAMRRTTLRDVLNA